MWFNCPDLHKRWQAMTRPIHIRQVLARLFSCLSNRSSANFFAAIFFSHLTRKTSSFNSDLLYIIFAIQDRLDLLMSEIGVSCDSANIIISVSSQIRPPRNCVTRWIMWSSNYIRDCDQPRHCWNTKLMLTLSIIFITIEHLIASVCLFYIFPIDYF